MRQTKAFAAALGAALLCGAALAKLPPPTEEQKAKAEEAKAKAAEAAKNDAEALTRAQERVAERYLKAKGASAAPGAPAAAQAAAAGAPAEVTPARK